MLWFMRRPWMKRLQRASLKWFKNPKVVESMKGQNRLARKYGLGTITVAINVLFASFLVTGSYLLAIRLYESGALNGPQALNR